MPLWCNEKLAGQGASIHCSEFFAVLPVYFSEFKYIIFGFFSNTFGFFYFSKKAKSNSAFLAN